MVEEIELIDIWNILKKKAVLIILFGLLGSMLAAVYTYFIVIPEYSATTQLLVNQTNNDQGGVELNDINTNIRLIDTYRELITGPAILNGVSEELGEGLTTEQLARMISINSPQNAQVFNLTINNINPYDAADIANTIASTFQEEIGSIMNSIDNVVITYEAVPRLTPVSPNHTLNILIGLVLGIMIGLVIVFIQYTMDGTLRDKEFITEEIGWTDLGSIQEFSSKEAIIANRSRVKNQRRHLKRM